MYPGGYGACAAVGYTYGLAAAGCSTCPCAVMIEPGGRATLFGGAGIGCAGGSGCTGCMGMVANIPACWGCELSRTMDISTRLFWH